MPAYAKTEEVQARMTRTMSAAELKVCGTLLEDAGVLIDAYKNTASDTAKQLVSCRMVARALGAGDMDIPIGASQGSMSGLGYSQSWTMGTGGSVGELYLSKNEKQLLGGGNSIGAYSPLED